MIEAIIPPPIMTPRAPSTQVPMNAPHDADNDVADSRQQATASRTAR